MSLKKATFSQPEYALLDELDKLIDYSQGIGKRVTRITLNEKQWGVWLSAKSRALEHRLMRDKLDPVADEYRKVSLVVAAPVKA